MVHKKHIVSGALVLLLASGGLFFSAVRVHAEDNGGDRQGMMGQTGDHQGDRGNGQDQFHREDDQGDMMDQDEDGIHSMMDNFNVDVSSTLPEVAPETLVTYADVAAVLQTYNTALDQLASQANVTSTLGAGLNQTELTLLTSIMSRHMRPFNQLGMRIKEIKDQMQVVTSLLSPLGATPIAPVLKQPLVAVLRNFHDEIQGLNDFEHMSFDILNFETAN